jgi:hypothetical protein
MPCNIDAPMPLGSISSSTTRGSHEQPSEAAISETIAGGGVVIQGWDEHPGSDADRPDRAGAV